MEPVAERFDRKQWGRRIGIGVVVGSALALLLVILETDRNPRTDDASVRANFIEIAPEVTGRLVELPVKDNAFVKKGGLLFVIDPRPYEYALQQALSDQAALEEKIVDERMRNKHLQYRVRWQGEGPEGDKWLPASELEDCEALDNWQASKPKRPRRVVLRV